MEVDLTIACKICSLKHKEICIVLKGLLKRLAETKYIKVTAFKDRFYNGSFAKMLNCILKTHPTITPQSLQCPHTSVKQKFLKILQWDEEYLNEVSQIIIMSTIKRNYQLETIISQVKQAQFTIPELNKSLSNRRFKKKTKIHQKQSKNKLSSVSIEQVKKQEIQKMLYLN